MNDLWNVRWLASRARGLPIARVLSHVIVLPVHGCAVIADTGDSAVDRAFWPAMAGGGLLVRGHHAPTAAQSTARMLRELPQRTSEGYLVVAAYFGAAHEEHWWHAGPRAAAAHAMCRLAQEWQGYAPRGV